MRIAKSLFNILLWFLLGCLAINFVRMTLTGDTGNFLSFRTILEMITTFNFEADALLKGIFGTLKSIKEAILNISTLSTLWSGGTWYEKVLSVFIGVFAMLKGVVDFIIALAVGSYHVVVFFLNFFQAILTLFTGLTGNKWLPIG